MATSPAGEANHRVTALRSQKGRFSPTLYNTTGSILTEEQREKRGWGRGVVVQVGEELDGWEPGE